MRVALIRAFDNDTKPNYDKGRWSLDSAALGRHSR